MSNPNTIEQEAGIYRIGYLNDGNSFPTTMDDAVSRQQELLGKIIAEELAANQQEREAAIENGQYVHGASYDEARRIMDAGGYLYGLC